VSAAEAMLVQYERLIRKLAWRCLRRLPRHTSYTHDDLYQEGAAVALRALQLHRVKQTRFITYLYTALAHRYLLIQRKEWAKVTRLPARSLWRWRNGREVLLTLPVAPGQVAVDRALDLTATARRTPLPRSGVVATLRVWQAGATPLRWVALSCGHKRVCGAARGEGVVECFACGGVRGRRPLPDPGAPGVVGEWVYRDPRLPLTTTIHLETP